ncbi:MAG: DNA cytosine methyltransferase [Dehalococcoidia bacterium]|nr:DNA cytosine methyltransferase [Dehalococcoidia bacterium]
MLTVIRRSRELVVDNFAGGGGASTGIEAAIGRPVDIAINHDREAVAMHQVNHPETLHIQDDIWSVDPVLITQGHHVRLAWFSPDCTHFSKAAGRKPRSQKIRGLAWVVIEWAAAVQPDVIMLENVEEFRTWGPLDEDGYPIKEQAGETFAAWKDALEGLGYVVEFRELRASDYGTPTIRKRLFIIARRDGQPIRWPEPTHGAPSMLEPHLEPYRTAAECIDWSIPVPSIFERERELAEATQRRIAAGLKRFVIDDPDPFIVPSYLVQSGWGEREGQAPRVMDMREPLGTVVAGGIKHALVTPYMASLDHQSSPKGVNRPDEALTTITTKARHLFLAPSLVPMNFTNAPMSLRRPLGTVTSQHNRFQLTTAWLVKHFGGMVGVRGDTPLPTVTTRNTQVQIATSNLIHLRGTGTARSIEEAMPTITAGGNHIAEVRAFLLKFYGNERDGHSLSEPLGTVTTRDRFGVVVTIHGEPYVIYDIGMRMLTPRELYRAQGFPEGYVIDPVVPTKYGPDGSPLGYRRLPKTHQVRMCGNSVCPPVAEALVEANVGRLVDQARWPGWALATAGLEAAG